jgi:ribosomal protein S18 acetylase RimI-like enzyme
MTPPQSRTITTAASEKRIPRSCSLASLTRRAEKALSSNCANGSKPDSEVETRLAVIDSTPIGHFTVHGNQLVHLFVDPDHQGMGLGSRLLAQGEAMIVANGHSDFELHTRVENLAAIAFYRARGWTMTDQLIHTVEHGISYCEHVMVKHLP